MGCPAGLWYRHSMSDLLGKPLLWPRAILLLLLGLLLPLQSSLAYARSVAMLTAPQSTQSELVITLVSVNEMPPVTEHAHHHSSQDFEAGMNIDLSPEYHHASAAAKPCHSDAPTGKSSHDCAKCCLIGAVAPPPYTFQSHGLSTTRRVLIIPAQLQSGFIPDGLERPPRTYPA